MPIIPSSEGIPLSLPPRYSPLRPSADAPRTSPVPDKYLEDLELLKAEILAQRDRRTGDYVENDGRFPRWWKGAVTIMSMQCRYAVSLAANNEHWAVVRRIPVDIPTLDNLTIPPGAARSLRHLGAVPSGLILVAGATGAGKTTTAVATLSSFLREHKRKAYTIEDPPEFLLHGMHGEGLCIQTDVESNGGWINGIKAALRSSPDYIFLGEIRDTAVAMAALRAAMSGHLVLTTIHAGSVTDALDAFVRLVDGANSPSVREQFAQQLVTIVHQVRVNATVTMNILDARKQERKKDIRRLLSENRTAALGDNWTESFGIAR